VSKSLQKICVAWLVVSPFFLQAQSSGSVRSKYIKDFPDDFFIWPLVKQRTTSFDIALQKDRGQKLTYRPNNDYGLGVGIYAFGIGAEVTFAIQPKQSSQDIYGHSSASDLQLNLISKRWGMDIFTQHYAGFYVSEPNKSIPSGMPFPQRPDISTWNTGLNGIYVFNKNKYSLKSDYNFSEKQLKSGGSFILSGTLNTFSLRADSAVYGLTYENVFGPTSAFQKLDYTTLSIAPGYGHTFAIKNFFFNASLSIGPANHWVSYQSHGVNYNSTTLNSFLDARLALGYNGDKFFTGITFISQARNMKFQQVEFTSSNSTFKFLVGFRFREKGILKKNVWDLLPGKKTKGN
jgi:hypothetical protein